QGQGSFCPFEAIYQFGDSISDTGNIDFINHQGKCSKEPFGETYFHHPVGRCSDGLLMVDYFAQALRLPFLSPYQNKSADTSHGVDFAVAGSTALDLSFFQERNVTWPNSANNRPISVQLSWFQEHLNNSICKTLTPSECATKLSKALFLIGEIGFNDFNWPFNSGTKIEGLATYIPPVVQAITGAVKEVIRQGAVRIIVSGLFPMGCVPFYNRNATYVIKEPKDEFQCLKPYNDLASNYNKNLQEALSLLGKEFPNAVILYADYYNAFMSLLRRAQSLGFNETTLLKPCYIPPKINSTTPAFNCSNPAQYIFFDNVHPTQAAYKHMAEYLIDNTLSKIPCTQ
ncbi:GDSL lipase/esterase, partial [Dillenia turbinata]